MRASGLRSGLQMLDRCATEPNWANQHYGW
jgi:hypothetical protein